NARTLVVTTTSEAVRAALARAAGAAKVELRKEIRAVLAKDAKNAAGLVMLRSAIARLVENAGLGAEHFSTIDHVTATLTVDEDIHVEIATVHTDAATAGALAGGVKQGLEFFSKNGYEELCRRFDVQAAGDRVTLRGDVGGEVFARRVEEWLRR